MVVKSRYLTHVIQSDLCDKMVFVGGPRQVGKTTVATELVAQHYKNATYFSWDDRDDRILLLNKRWSPDSALIILDEIHKYPEWKNYIKGVFDKQKKHHHFLVTGSARLDLYRRGGDSLQGRYFYYRLHPFSAFELAMGESLTQSITPLAPLQFNDSVSQALVESLFQFGGYPEPFLKQSMRFLNRWHNNRNDRLIKEDIRDVEPIRESVKMDLLRQLLPERAGSLFSLNALKRDVAVSYTAAAHWVDILESFYYCYRIYPFQMSTIKSLRKEPKLFLWDWSEIQSEGARFENMIAGHLLKFCHFLNDYEGVLATLQYIRDKNKKEIDFLVTIKGKPWFGCEVKLHDTHVQSAVHTLKKKMDIPYLFQVVKSPDVDFMSRDVRVLSANKFLSGLI